MGKWDRRWVPRRRNNNNNNKYRDYHYEQPPPSPPSPHHPQSNPPPIQNIGGSSWEIEFCKSVTVPWKKVLAAKNYMYCHETVAKWDDSASEEAFHDAKRRYWEKINCLPYETPLPDKDMYIDEINWNPCIDPKLISELDREYFNPDDPVRGVGTLRDNWRQNTTSRNNAWKTSIAEAPAQADRTHWGQKAKSINSKGISSPCERSHIEFDESLMDKDRKGYAGESPAQEVGIHCGRNAESKDISNPWEQICTGFDDSSKNNAWEGSEVEHPSRGVGTHWGQNAKSIISKDVSNPWEQICPGFDDSPKNNAWEGSAVEPPSLEVGTHWGQNANSMNSKDVSNPWEQSCTQFEDSFKNNAWKTSAAESSAQGVGKVQNTESINSEVVGDAWKGSAGEGPPAQVVRTHLDQNANSTISKGVNPWEQSCTSADESSWNKAWNGCPEECSGWRKESTYNRWSRDDGNEGWRNVDNRYRGQKQWNFSSHEQQFPLDTSQRSFPSRRCDSRGWTEYGNNNSRGWKQQNKKPMNINYRGGSFGGGRAIECRKREGPVQHSSRYKSSRFQGDDIMTPHKWH